MIPYNPQGLTPEEVAASRAAHGENIITPQRDDSAWRLLAEKFRDPIIIVLLVAAALSLAMAFMEGNFTETIGILCAILLATCVGFLFEWDAMRRFRRLNRVNDEQPVKVRRGGVMREIPRREVVVGDLVSLEAGETVPADGELVEAVSLQMDESTLTGEPETAKYVDEELFDPEATYPSNRLLRGTTVRDGYGRMVVTAVGDATEAGRVTEQATVQSGEQTPLHRQLTRLSRQIGKVGIALSVLIFVILIGKAFLVEGLADAPWPHVVRIVLNCFMVSVAMIVMAVPEGLPMSITLSLALSMRRMLKTNNLVRKMHACETMGAVTVICTDKTGTLTQNRMRVQEIIRYGLPDERLLGESVAANSTAFLDADGRPLGNPTEGALLEWLRRENGDYAALREGVRILDRLTFSTERKYMATVVKSPLLGKKVLYVKGAPEIVLANSQRVAIDNTYKPVDACKADIEKQLLDYQNQAMRTLGFAYQIIEDGQDESFFVNGRLHNTDLTYLGIVAISDPVRADVPAAVQSCLNAGIDVKIVTGDTPGTAREIGRQIGTWKPEDTDRNIITGPGFEALTDEEVLDRVLDLKIMCRARPTDKQRLVQLLQKKGAVVAVTGDGTNDAPALKAAQVGLSMGDGTSVAKEASDITILDNSFGSITRAVMWGRSLYRNIQKFLLFQLTINVAACLIVLLGSLFGTESPLTITQMLWVNLIMDTFAAGALASLPPNERVMKDKPRRSGKDGDFIITRPMAYNIFGVGIAFVLILMGVLYYFHAQTGLTPHDLSWFFSFFVMLQFWNMFNAKAFMEGRSAFANLKESKSFLFVALLILIGQYLIVTFGGEMFNVVPLSLKDWGIIIGSSSLVLWIGEIARGISRLTKK